MHFAFGKFRMYLTKVAFGFMSLCEPISDLDCNISTPYWPPFPGHGNIVDERMKMRVRQPYSSIERRASPPSLNPVSVIPLCKVAGSASLTFCPFFRGICMTEARREVCCPGNALPPFAVGAEVLREQLGTMASEIRLEGYMFVRAKVVECFTGTRKSHYQRFTF